MATACIPTSENLREIDLMMIDMGKQARLESLFDPRLTTRKDPKRDALVVLRRQRHNHGKI